MIARLLGDASVAGEVGRLEGGLLRRRLPRAVAGLAAAAVLVLALLPLLPRTESGDEFRDEPLSQAAPVLVAPLARAERLESLRWHGVEGASQYRVTVFDEEGGRFVTSVFERADEPGHAANGKDGTPIAPR